MQHCGADILLGFQHDKNVGHDLLGVTRVAYTLRGSHEDLESLSTSTTARIFHGTSLAVFYD